MTSLRALARNLPTSPRFSWSRGEGNARAVRSARVGARPRVRRRAPGAGRVSYPRPWTPFEVDMEPPASAPLPVYEMEVS